MPGLKYKDSQGNIKPVRAAAINVAKTVISPLSVTENGTYIAPSGVDGYSPVTVNVSPSYPLIIDNGYVSLAIVKITVGANNVANMKAVGDFLLSACRTVLNDTENEWYMMSAGLEQNVTMSQQFISFIPAYYDGITVNYVTPKIYRSGMQSGAYIFNSTGFQAGYGGYITEGTSYICGMVKYNNTNIAPYTEA